MPAHYRQAKLSTSRLQDAAKKIFRIERSAIAAGKDQNLLIGTCQHTALRQEGLADWLAHGHVSATALRLRASKSPFIDCLAHVDHVVNKIDVFPAEREQFANP